MCVGVARHRFSNISWFTLIRREKENLQIVIFCVLLVTTMLTQRSRGLGGGKSKKKRWENNLVDETDVMFWR